MPYRGVYNILEVTDKLIYPTGVLTVPQLIKDNNIQPIISNIVVVCDSSTITGDVKIFLPKIITPGKDLKIVNLNKFFNLNIEVDNVSNTKINSSKTQVTLKPLSNIYIVSITELDWYIF